jgi:N-acetyl-anhydromuramyl-L-alanine amidase AmpD
MNFNGRDSLVRQVQQLLGVAVDGKDGPATWNAIKDRLQPQQPPVTIQPPAIILPSTNKFSETIKLSKQTTGQYSQKIIPTCIVLHHTSGNYEGSIDWTSRVFDTSGKRLYASYHCIIARDGRRTITNLDDNRAYHAGTSSFKGKSSLNGWSLGVAFERDTNTEPLQDSCIESALEYIIPRMKKWNITLDNVTDHRTIAPGRKNDLAPKEYKKFMNILRARWNSGK